MKYRKKPIIIEAEQWFRDKKHPDVLEDEEMYVHNGGLYARPIFYLKTPRGRLIIKEGDFIITGIDGEKYPCKPDIFEASYEVV